jgi:hypothetical protein
MLVINTNQVRVVINTNQVHVLPYEPLTKIKSDIFPSALSICKLKKELYVNVRSIPSTLGGGIYGHLGLVMTPEAYATIDPPPGEVFELPGTPEPLDFPGNAHAATVALLQAEHKTEVNTYNICLVLFAVMQ